jgi:polysaccharide biosynthesis protein VpsQ
MKRKIPMIAALVFIATFLSIIVIANRGEGGNWWAFINDIPCGDKVGHLGLVGTLSLLCNLAFQPRGKWRIPRWITPTTLVLFILLTLEEISQAFQPYRTCDPFDWLADIAGLALGQYVASKLRRFFFH